MSIFRRPRSPFWYCYIRHGGKRIRRSLGTSDKLKAQEKHDELAAGAWKIRARGKHLADALLAWYTKKPRKPSALRALRQIRRDYADRPLGEVTEASIVATWGHKAPGTYNKLAGVMRSAMNIAAENGWVAAAPKITRRAEPIVEPRYLTAAEWKRLRAELPEHLQPMASFAIATGLRWANVSGLTWDRISMQRKITWIPASTAKAGKTIPVPLSAAALQALRDAGGDRAGFVFTYHGKPLGSPKTAWNKAVVRAGVPWCRWHDLRHTWASWHAMRGTPLDVLQKLGGWETREMVERYSHLAPTYVSQFAGNARPVAGNRGRKSA